VNDLKAITTPYDGCLFRSRREARWAVFFNAAGIPWEYEPQGYDLGGAGWYLPDFRINADTHSELFFEVKGQIPTRDELTKAEALAEQSKLHVYVYFAQPKVPAPPSLAEMGFEMYWRGLSQRIERDIAREWLKDPATIGLPVEQLSLFRTWIDDLEATAYAVFRMRDGGCESRKNALWWTDCPHCGLVVPKLWGQVGCCPGGGDSDYPSFRYATKRLLDAYDAARSARFTKGA